MDAGEFRLTPAQGALFRVLEGAYPGALSRERIRMALAEQGRPTSRTALRQQIHRLESVLGKGSLRVEGDSVALTRKIEARLAPERQCERAGESPSYDSLVEDLRDTVVGVASFNRDEARSLLVSQSWFARALSSAGILKLLATTRPESQESPFFGEHRNLETLVMMSQGLPRDAALARIYKSKKIARRYGAKGAFRTAGVLEAFSLAGEASLPFSPELGPRELAALSFHQRLAYLANFFLEAKVEQALRATEAMLPLISEESPSSQLHFWANATVLSIIPEGREFAEEARRQCELAPGFLFDRNTQRCVSLSLARDRLHVQDADEAEAAATRYKDISESMGWATIDYHEVMVQASALRGNRFAARRHFDEWVSLVDRSGHGEKRLLLSLRRRLEATVL